jgi:hypothetical protein
MFSTIFVTSVRGIFMQILLHVHPLLGNVFVNKFPRKQILGKQSVARLRKNRGCCVFCVRGDITQRLVVVT